MSWYRSVIEKLIQAGIFDEVRIVGAKIRASIDVTTFVDIHYDPATQSYSYALIDMKLPYPGDKRVFGWDDYPHEGVKEIKNLESYPHHFQRRKEDGTWLFEKTMMRGKVEDEVDIVIAKVRDYLVQKQQ